MTSIVKRLFLPNARAGVGKTLLAAAMVVGLASSPDSRAFPAPVAISDAPTKRVKRKVATGTLVSYPRSKNPPTKRKLKGNRLHTSRRTRRKHRRAAA